MERNYFYDRVAEENRVNMLKSYYNIHHNSNNNYINTSNISTKDYILKNINYKNKESIKNGIDELYIYINNLELYYLSINKDPDEIKECNDLWIKYYELKNLLNN